MKRINKILTSILIVLIFNSCQKPVQDKITESDIYNFLNEIIPTLTTEKKCDAIVNKPILNISGGKTTTTEDLLSIKTYIKRFNKNKWIKRKDIDYLFSQLNDTIFILKQNQIQTKLISSQTLDSIFSLPNSNGYFILKEKLDIASFGKISKPYFTSDKNTAILFFEVFRNYENANGYIIIYKKIDNKWSEFERLQTWIS